ncbi:hypothetical protein ACFE04_015429 [Oxalis oulophora]
MADICCEKNETTLSESSPHYEFSSSRAARRRRMEIRRLRFVTPTEDVDDHLKKRQRLLRQCVNTMDNFDYENNNNNNSNNVKVDNNGKVRRQTSLTLTLSLPLTLPLHEKEQVVVVVAELPKFGVASVCGRRRDMEDAVSVLPSFKGDDSHYFAVYDGHGCSHVATRCRERLHELVKDELNNYNNGNSEYWKNAMERSFTRMDNEVKITNDNNTTTTNNHNNDNHVLVGTNCRCELQTPECDTVGSTAVVSVVTNDKIIVANCGDSRAVLCRNGKAIPLSSDHKPDRPDELHRIQEAGGRVIYWDGPRVLGVLAMSRAIGDNYLKPYVSCEPEVTVTDRSVEDDCLILASDGLWDVVSNETACGVARMCLRGKSRFASEENPDVLNGSSGCYDNGEISDKACGDASMLLTKLALARHTSDNVSVVVVDLRRDT